MATNVQVFEFVLVFQPKDEKEQPKFLSEVTKVLAVNEAEARVKAARAIPELYADRLSEVSIFVRPFQR